MIRLSTYIFFILLAFTAYSQELYKYTDENGVEQIVDSPYKLPENMREKHIKEYEKKKKKSLPPDMQITRPAYKDSGKSNLVQEEINREDQAKEKKKAEKEKEKKIQELTLQMEETIKELGYKTQRSLITQIPELKAEVEKLKQKIEEIKQEIEKLSSKEENNKK